ncbi:MAG: S4 domain-containing protein [Terriglobia bacterium]
MRPGRSEGEGTPAESKEPKIRLDLFLKYSRLVPRRSVAHDICTQGAVLINGHAVKASHLLRPGDQFEMRLRGQLIKVRVLKVPVTACSKEDAPKLYTQDESPYVQRFPK